MIFNRRTLLKSLGIIPAVGAAKAASAVTIKDDAPVEVVEKIVHKTIEVQAPTHFSLWVEKELRLEFDVLEFERPTSRRGRITGRVTMRGHDAVERFSIVDYPDPGYGMNAGEFVVGNHSARKELESMVQNLRQSFYRRFGVDTAPQRITSVRFAEDELDMPKELGFSERRI